MGRETDKSIKRATAPRGFTAINAHVRMRLHSFSVGGFDETVSHAGAVGFAPFKPVHLSPRAWVRSRLGMAAAGGSPARLPGKFAQREGCSFVDCVRC